MVRGLERWASVLCRHAGSSRVFGADPARMFLLVAAAVLVVPAGASAHPCVDEARRLVGLAEFTAAERALAGCDDAADLTRGDLARYYETRALLDLGNGDEEALARDLRRLAAVSPRHDFAADVPPDVRDAFADAARDSPEPTLELRTTATPDRVEVRAVSRDPAGVVRQLTIHGRPAGGAWQQRDGERLLIEAAEQRRVEYWAELRGLGDAPLVRVGSERAPRVYDCAICAVPVVEAPVVEEDDGGAPWLLVGGGVALAVAAVVAVVLLSGGGADGQPGRPVPMGFE